MEYMIGGDMCEDIQHMADVSSKVMQEHRIVKQAEQYILNSGDPELIKDWEALPPEHKLIAAGAVVTAFNAKFGITKEVSKNETN